MGDTRVKKRRLRKIRPVFCFIPEQKKPQKPQATEYFIDHSELGEILVRICKNRISIWNSDRSALDRDEMARFLQDFGKDTLMELYNKCSVESSPAAEPKEDPEESVNPEEELASCDEAFALPEGEKSYSVILRGARTKEGLTQEEVSERTGISQSNISAMETGRRTIGKNNAQRLAEVLNIDYRLLL